MPQIQNSPLPEITASERTFRWLNANGKIAPVAAPSAPPIQVQGPDGAIVEFPADTPREEMTRALRAHYGGPSNAPAQPSAATHQSGMFDDLIPTAPLQSMPATAPSGVPPLPPGFVLDAPVKQVFRHFRPASFWMHPRQPKPRTKAVCSTI